MLMARAFWRSAMLCLTLDLNERLQIGPDVVVTVYHIRKGDKVRIGIIAPRSLEIVREGAKNKEPRHPMPALEQAERYVILAGDAICESRLPVQQRETARMLVDSLRDFLERAATEAEKQRNTHAQT
jgi:carbon storage regulator CsrA